MEKSGVAHFAGENDEDTIRLIKELLAFFPQNNREKPPVIHCTDDPNRMDESLKTAVPDDSKKAYDMKKIVVVGIGYVGTAVACAFAKVGYHVVGIDNQRWKVDAINKGISPIEGDEPNLKELLKKVVKQKRLSATTDFSSSATTIRRSPTSTIWICSSSL
jgi:NADPH-dependent 2,4-dienoyl-CoA reductase/sulfur reductase-like enzyme